MLKRILFVAAFLLWSVPAFAARTRYISITGSNAADGLTTTTPWQYPPGSPGCTSVCAAFTPTGDDTIILKGGDTFGTYIDVAWNGTSGHPITYSSGDHSWFTGGSWTRPILDLNYTGSHIVQLSGNSYVTFDSIEMKRQLAVDPNTGAIIAIYTSTNIVMTNLYIHGWRLPGSGPRPDGFNGGVMNYTDAMASTLTMTDSLIENSENTGSNTQYGGAIHSIGTLTRNTIHDVFFAVIFTLDWDHGLMYNVSYPSGNGNGNTNESHSNGVYLDPLTLGASIGYCRNSIFHDIGEGGNGCLLNARGGDTAVAYNNIFYGVYPTAQMITGDSYQYTMEGGGNLYIANNLCYMVDSVVVPTCIHAQARVAMPYLNVTIVNNYCIATGRPMYDTTSGDVSGTLTVTTNYPNDNTCQAPATAIAQGFTQANLWRMINTAGSIYHTGTDLSAVFTTDMNGLTRTGAWDIGPYIFQTHRDWYVATTGLDTQDGTITYPFLTFNQAQSVAVCGDIIYGRAGTYAGANFIGNPNNAYVECPNYDVPVTVRNYSTEHVILQPGGGIGQALDFTTDDCTPNHYWKIIASAQDKITIDCLHCQYQSNYSVRLSGNYVWLENLEVINAWQSGISAGCAHHTLVNLNVHDNGNVATSPQPHGIYASTQNMLIDGGLYHDNVAGFGIQIFASGHSDLDDNIVRNTRVYNNGASSQDNCCGGIGLFNGHRNTAYNNIVYNNAGGNAMEANFLSSAAAFYGNTVYGNTGGCVVIGSSSVAGTIFKNNICYLNGSAITDNGSGSSISNNTTANPSFTNAAGGNFTLTMGSAAIAQGADLTSLCTGLFLSLCTDFVGVARGTTPDNGAYQYASGSPASLASVVPGTGLLGQTLDVTVTGASTSFANGTTVAAFSGAGITTNSTTCSSAVLCVANITIAANTAVGYRNVTMTTDMEVVTAMSAFQVVPVPTANGGGIRLRLRIRR